MAVTVTVSLNGPLFSSLYYELANCSGDQEGFLLGEINRHVTDVINDAEIANLKEEIVLSLTSVVPCERIHCFYSNSGEVIENNLNALIGDRVKEVVGWYRFRRSTCTEPMILEQRLHRHLSRWCAQNLSTSQKPIREQLFLFGIFTSSTSPNLATHSFDHSFFRFAGRAFEGLTCTVINLGDTSQLEYKSQSHLGLPVYLGVVDRLVQKSNTVAGSANSAIAQIASIHDSLESNLQGLCTQVSKDEALVRKLKRDVELMRNQLRIRESAAASPATPGTPDPDSLWLNVHSPLSTSSSGLSRSSSTNISTSHQALAGPSQSVTVGKRQPTTSVADAQSCKSNNVARPTTGSAKNGTSFVSGMTSCTSTTPSCDSGVGASVQRSVFGAPPSKQTFGTGQGMVFGIATSAADGSSKAAKHFVPQVANQTGYRTSEVPELSSQRNTNPFRVDTQFVNDDSRDNEGVRHPVGKR